MSSLEDPIDPAFARSVLTDTSSDQLPPELLDELVDELVKIPARVWKEMFAALLCYDDLAELDGIIVPTLLVWGDADGLVRRDMQDTLAERIRGADCASIKASVTRPAGRTPPALLATLLPSSNDRRTRNPLRAEATQRTTERRARGRLVTNSRRAGAPGRRRTARSGEQRAQRERATSGTATISR